MPDRLLTMQELVDALDDELAPLEPDLTGLRLVAPGDSQSDVDKLQALLGVEFPPSFASTIMELNLGSLTIGPTVFGYATKYTDLLHDANVEPVVRWWGSGERQASLVMFGNSDPFALVVDCTSGEVLALQHGEGLDRAVVVAADFDLFLRGVGTVFIARQAEPASPELGASIGSLVGSSPEGLSYWTELAG